MKLKMACLLDVTARSVVEIHRRFKGAYCCRHHHGDHSDDEGSKYL